MSETRRVLVTGGAGFVGATLVRRLAAGGNAVRVLDNYSTGQRALPAETDLALRRQQARWRGLRARLCEVVRDAHGGAAVRERLRPLERAQTGSDDRVLPGHPHRRADRDLRRRLVVA